MVRKAQHQLQMVESRAKMERIAKDKQRMREEQRVRMRDEEERIEEERATEEARKRPPQPRPNFVGVQLRILLIDDRIMARLTNARLLDKMGYRYVNQSDSVTCARVLRKMSEHTDLIMLGGGKYCSDVILQVRSNGNCAHIPVVIVATKEDMQHATQAKKSWQKGTNKGKVMAMVARTFVSGLKGFGVAGKVK